MKYCLGIVLYNPREESLERIRKYNRSVLFSKIIIYDNSLVSHKEILPPNIIFLRTGKNDGLSKPYNDMIKLAIEADMDYLCLLDQDSDYCILEIEKMIKFLDSCPSTSLHAAVLAPRTYKVGSKRVDRSESITSVKYAINSGSFLNLKIINHLNLRYDERVYIDGVDYDFGWQIRAAGYKSLIYENSVFEQSLGYSSGNSRFSHHSSVRYYLIAHNRKYIYTKHIGFFLGGSIALLKNLLLIIKILLYEDQKRIKVRYCFKGILH